jgi:hypothetical protein
MTGPIIAEDAGRAKVKTGMGGASDAHILVFDPDVGKILIHVILDRD